MVTLKIEAELEPLELEEKRLLLPDEASWLDAVSDITSRIPIRCNQI